MTEVGVWFIAASVVVPWLMVALWASLRFRRSESGLLAIAMVLPRLAVFVGLAVCLTVVAWLGLFFWANIAASTPVAALLAHAASLVPAYWVMDQQSPPLEGVAAKLFKGVVFLGVAFWLPLFVLVIGALIYEALW